MLQLLPLRKPFSILKDKLDQIEEALVPLVFSEHESVANEWSAKLASWRKAYDGFLKGDSGVLVCYHRLVIS